MDEKISTATYEAWLEQVDLSAESRTRLGQAVPETQDVLRNRLTEIVSTTKEQTEASQTKLSVQEDVHQLLIDFETFQKIEALGDEFIEDLQTIVNKIGGALSKDELLFLEEMPELAPLVEKEIEVEDIRDSGAQREYPYSKCIINIKNKKPGAVEEATELIDRESPELIEGIPLEIKEEDLYKLLKIAYEVSPEGFIKLYSRIKGKLTKANPKAILNLRKMLLEINTERAESNAFCYKEANQILKELLQGEQAPELAALALKIVNAASNQGKKLDNTAHSIEIMANHLCKLNTDELVQACTWHPDLYQELYKRCYKQKPQIARLYLLASRLGKSEKHLKKLKRGCQSRIKRKQNSIGKREEAYSQHDWSRKAYKRWPGKARKILSVITEEASKALRPMASISEVIDYYLARAEAGKEVSQETLKQIAELIQEEEEKSYKIKEWDKKGPARREIEKNINNAHKLGELGRIDLSALPNRGMLGKIKQTEQQRLEYSNQWEKEFQKYKGLLKHPRAKEVIQRAKNRRYKKALKELKNSKDLEGLVELANISSLPGGEIQIEESEKVSRATELTAAITAKMPAEDKKKCAPLISKITEANLSNPNILRVTKWLKLQEFHPRTLEDYAFYAEAAPSMTSLTKKEVIQVCQLWRALRRNKMSTDTKMKCIQAIQEQPLAIAALGKLVDREALNIRHGGGNDWEKGRKVERAKKVTENTLQLIQHFQETPPEMLAVVIEDRILKTFSNETYDNYQDNTQRPYKSQEDTVQYTLKAIQSIPEQQELYENLPPGIGKKDFALIYYKISRISDQEFRAEVIQHLKTSPRAVKKIVDDYREISASYGIGGNREILLESFIGLAQHIDPNDAAEITIKHARGYGLQSGIIAKLIGETPGAASLLKSGLPWPVIEEIRKASPESLHYLAQSPSKTEVLQRILYNRKQPKNDSTKQEQEKQLQFILKAAKHLPSSELQSFAYNLKIITAQQPIENWEQAQIILLASYDGKLEQEEVIHQIIKAIEQDWLIIQALVGRGLTQSTLNQALEKMSEGQKEEALKKSLKKRVERAVNKLSYEITDTKAKRESGELKVHPTREDDFSEDMRQKEEKLQEARNIEFSTAQIKQLVQLSKSAGGALVGVCYQLISKWSSLNDGNYLEQVRGVYETWKPKNEKAKNNYERITTTLLPENWETLKDGRYVAYLKSLYECCEEEDQQTLQNISELATILAENWNFLGDPVNLKFMTYLRKAKDLQEYYLRAMGGHTTSSTYDASLHFSGEVVSTEEIKAIQETFISYFNLKAEKKKKQKDDQKGFQKFNENRFKIYRKVENGNQNEFRKIITELEAAAGAEFTDAIIQKLHSININENMSVLERICKSAIEKRDIRTLMAKYFIKFQDLKEDLEFLEKLTDEVGADKITIDLIEKIEAEENKGADGNEVPRKNILRLIKNNYSYFKTLLAKVKADNKVRKISITLWLTCKDKPETLEITIANIEKIDPFEKTFAIKYIAILIEEGEEAAEKYKSETIEKAKGLNDPTTATVLREDPNYQWMVRYIYADGNYSSYEKNLSCGDHPDHLEGYTFNPDGYAIRLSGLTGYRVKEDMEEDTQLLQNYQKRLLAVKNFVEAREPTNEALQKALQEKVDIVFRKHAHPKFKALETEDTKLNIKERLLCLYISEVIRKIETSGRAEQNPKTEAVVLSAEAGAAVTALNKEITLLLNEVKDCSPERTLEINQRLKALRAKKKSLEGKKVDEGYQLNTEILDLMVIYHYAYNEHLDPYITRSADNIKAEKDTVAQNYLLWQELSNIYGENIKHSLRHDFSTQNQEDLPRVDAITGTYKIIIQQASESGKIPQEQIKEKQRSGIIKNLIENDRIPNDKKYGILCRKIFAMVLGPLKLTKEEKEELKAALEEALMPFKVSPTVETLDELLPKIYALRAPFRVKFETKMEELFTADINAINLEIDKYEEQTEVDTKQKSMSDRNGKEIKKQKKSRNIRGRYIKTKESANARMGAFLCIAGEPGMYASKNYFEYVFFDEDTGKCEGLTMHLSIEAKDGKKYLWFGPNPFESFLDKVSAERTFNHQYERVCEFAEQNGYDGVVVPSAEGRILGECTNRGGMFPDLIKKKRLKDEKGKLKIVQFGKKVQLGGSYGYSDGALIWEKKTA